MGNAIAKSLTVHSAPSIRTVLDLYQELQVPNLLHNIRAIALSDGKGKAAAVLRLYSLYKHPMLDCSLDQLQVAFEVAGPFFRTLLGKVTGESVAEPVFVSQGVGTSKCSASFDGTNAVITEVPTLPSAWERFLAWLKVPISKFASVIMPVAVIVVGAVFFGLSKIPGASFFTNNLAILAKMQRDWTTTTGDKTPFVKQALGLLGKAMDLDLTSSPDAELVVQCVDLDRDISDWLNKVQENPTLMIDVATFHTQCMKRLEDLEKLQKRLHASDCDIKNATPLINKIAANLDKIIS